MVRIIGLPLGGVLAYFVFRQGIPNPLFLTPLEKIFFDGIYFIMIGIGLSWKYELAGGLVTIAGYFMFTYAEGEFFWGPVFPLFLMLGLSNLLLGLLRKMKR